MKPKLLFNTFCLVLFWSLRSANGALPQPEVITIEPNVDGNLAITWRSWFNDTFFVYSTSELTTNTVWTLVATNIPSDGETTTWVDENWQQSMMSLSGGGQSQLSAASFSGEKEKPRWIEELEAYEFPPFPWDEDAQWKIVATYPGILPLPPWKKYDVEWVLTSHEATIKNYYEPNEGGGMQMASLFGTTPQRFYRIESTNWPGITLTAPTNGLLTNGLLNVSMVVTDDVSTAGVALWVDGLKRTSRMGAAPYSLTFDTTALSNGTHRLFAQVADGENHCRDSQTVEIQTDNFIHNYAISAAAFTPNGDGTNENISVSCLFKSNADWTVSIQDMASNTVRTVTGQGTNLNFSWDGTDQNTNGVGIGNYHLAVSAFPAGQTSAVPGNVTSRRPIYVDPGVPEWTQVNFHAYHGVEQGLLSQVLLKYFYLYTLLGAPSAVEGFQPDPTIYTYEIRLWCYLMGYEGDQAPEFFKEELYQNLQTDNVVYIMAHGAYDPTVETSGISDYDSSEAEVTIGKVSIEQAWQGYNSSGFLFVQMNACQSADHVDQNGNNDLAAGFGILNNPLTVGRAYLGWQGKVRFTLTTLFSFDQHLWENLGNGMTVEDAVADAWSYTTWTRGVPTIVGDRTLVMPLL